MAYTAWSVIAGEVPTTAKWNLLGLNDAEFNTKITQLFAQKTYQEIADAPTTHFDIGLSQLWGTELTGNRQLNVSNVPIGRAFYIRLKQDATGGRTVNWWAGIKWPGGEPPPLSTGGNLVDAFVFVCTASGQYDGYFAGFGLS